MNAQPLPLFGGFPDSPTWAPTLTDRSACCPGGDLHVYNATSTRVEVVHLHVGVDHLAPALVPADTSPPPFGLFDQ